MRNSPEEDVVSRRSLLTLTASCILGALKFPHGVSWAAEPDQKTIKAIPLPFEGISALLMLPSDEYSWEYGANGIVSVSGPGVKIIGSAVQSSSDRALKSLYDKRVRSLSENASECNDGFFDRQTRSFHPCFAKVSVDNPSHSIRQASVELVTQQPPCLVDLTFRYVLDIALQRNNQKLPYHEFLANRSIEFVDIVI